MRLSATILILALLGAPACGGGGGGNSGPGGSPSPIAAGFVPDRPSPAGNTIAMALGPTSNDIVTVRVNITDTNGVYATAFEVPYDDVYTSYLGYTPGTALEQGGNSPNYTVAANAGRIVIAVSRTGSTATDVVGSKPVLNLQFRVKATGVFPVTIVNAVAYDNQSTPQPLPGILWFAGAVTGA